MTAPGVPWDFLLILLFLGAVVPWRGAARIKQLLARPRLSTADRLALYRSTIFFQWLVVAVVAWRGYAHRMSPQQLGWAFANAELTTATALALVLFLAAIQFFNLRRLARMPVDHQDIFAQMKRKLMPRTPVEMLLFVALALTASLCEEFLYRGFVFALLALVAPESLVLPALGSSALFALAHSYQGRRGVAATFTVGLLFAIARGLCGSLVPSILGHLVTDLMAGLAAPRWLPKAPTVEAR